MVRVSERSASVTEGVSASVEWVADKGHWNAVRTPKVEEELPGVTLDEGVPRMAGGRVGGPGETGDPAEGSLGWEAPGFPRNVPCGSNRSEDEAWATGGPGDADCTLDRFVLKSSFRSWDVGLAGDADGDPGQELQLTGTSVSPRGFRATLARSP